MLKTLLPLMFVACTTQAAEVVHIYNWGEYIAPDTLQNFQGTTGIGTQYDVYDSNETLDAKLAAGHSGYDVVFPSAHFMAHQIKSGALKTLDRSKLPNWKNLNPLLMKALEADDPGNLHGVPYLWGTTGIGYNVDKVRAALGKDIPMNTWDVLFKPEILAKLHGCGVAVLDNGPELLPIALRYLGLPPHSKNPADYKKAEALLLQMRKNVTYFHSAKYIGDLANGDVCLAVGWSGDVMQAANRAVEAGNGVKVKYEIPKEGAPFWIDLMTMPVDAPNEAAGYAFINYMMEPKVAASISNAVRYANGNAAADSLVDPKLKADPAAYPPQEVMDRMFILEAMPLDIDRLRTRIWSKVKNGV